MSPQDESSRPWVALALAGLGALCLFSIYLGWTRIIQVDEAQWVTMARIHGLGKSGEFMVATPLMILGPVTWLARAAKSSSDLFHHVRMLFVGLMWVNLLLVVKATGARLRSAEGLALLILGATLEPLWDYGFEIRHDNPLLTGLLGMWLLLRSPGKLAPSAFFLAGLLAAVMQFVAFKAFLYALPILLLFLVVPGPALAAGRGKAILQTLLGLLVGALLGALVNVLAGTFQLFAGGVQASTRLTVSPQSVRFAPWPTLQRLLVQTPLLVGGALAVLLVPLRSFARPWKTAPSRLIGDPHFPEWAMLSVALGVLIANPTPFPYNLVLLVPFAFVAVTRHREPLVATIRDSRQGWLVWPLLAAGHLGPWLTTTPRHLEMSNERQLRVAALAEQLTDPARHRVFDGSGLVPTRDPIGYYWLIHTFTIRPLSDGTWPSIRSQLAANEVPVILPSYRTGLLPREDQAFITTHYIALAQDFLVLGARMERGEGLWTALAGGNYFLMLQGASAGEGSVEIDGKMEPTGPIHLERGPHHFRFPRERTLHVIWAGPRGGAYPRLENTEMPLFLNWY